MPCPQAVERGIDPVEGLLALLICPPHKSADLAVSKGPFDRDEASGFDGSREAFGRGNSSDRAESNDPVAGGKTAIDLRSGAWF